jgi:hypothetical protein
VINRVLTQRAPLAATYSDGDPVQMIPPAIRKITVFLKIRVCTSGRDHGPRYLGLVVLVLLRHSFTKVELLAPLARTSETSEVFSSASGLIWSSRNPPTH